MHILIAALHRPTKPTGVCRHAASLAQCLAELQEVTKVTLIVGTWQQHYFKKWFDSHKIELIAIDLKYSSFARNIWFLFGLPKLANNLKPDIIHLSFPFPFWRSLFSSPIVSTIHDFYPYENPEVFGFPNVLFNRLFLKICLNNSDALTCVSQSTLRSLKTYFPKLDRHKLITSIYNYVDFSQINPQKPKYLNFDEKDTFLLSVAQHRKNKNLDLLIQAFSELEKSKSLNNITKLIIVGSTGPETDNLKTQISELSLQEKVILFDSITDSELCWLYQNCHLFVAPSSQEGFCLPLAEAMSFSCNIVCSDIPIFREIAASNCTYFQINTNSVQNLSQAIAKSLENHDQKNYQELRFSKTKIAKQYLDFYSKLIVN